MEDESSSTKTTFRITLKVPNTPSITLTVLKTTIDSSEYFTRVFSIRMKEKQTQSMEISFDSIKERDEFEQFMTLLEFPERCRNLDAAQCLQFIQLMDQYYAEILSKNCADRLIEMLPELSYEILIQLLSEQDIPPRMINDAHIQRLQIFVCRALIKNFTTTQETYTQKMKWRELPYQVVLEWLTKEDLVPDSENSIYYLVMYWILHDLTNRHQYVLKLLPLIKFHQLEKNFILDTVQYHISKFEVSDPKTFFTDWYKKCLEYHLSPDRYVYRNPPLTNRPLLKEKSAMIKCVYKNIVRWVIQQKYYSQPVLLRGTELYFFLQINPLNADDMKTWQLAGFIRCLSDIGPSQFYLPLSFTLTLKLADNTERIFRSSVQILDDSEKALGCVLMTTGESWVDIINGTSLLLGTDGSITIVITIEFIDKIQN